MTQRVSGCIAIPVNKRGGLPSGAWADFECCKRLTKACLQTVCPNPHFVQDPIPWNFLEAYHDTEHLKRLRTSRCALMSVYELEDGVGENDHVMPEDEEAILTPARYAIACLWFATELAFRERRIIMCMAGGAHHASPSHSEGAGLFCDVPSVWLALRAQNPQTARRALYIDTDVHHANGFAKARVELHMQEHFFIMDAFNVDIWPNKEDGEPADSVRHVNIPLPFHCDIGNKAYLELLRGGLKRCATELPPVDLVFYQCNLDALKGDPLGHVNVTERAIYERDRTVVEWCHERDLPLVILPGRGYGASSCRVARESMSRLNDEYNIF